MLGTEVLPANEIVWHRLTCAAEVTDLLMHDTVNIKAIRIVREAVINWGCGINLSVANAFWRRFEMLN